MPPWSLVQGSGSGLAIQATTLPHKFLVTLRLRLGLKVWNSRFLRKRVQPSLNSGVFRIRFRHVYVSACHATMNQCEFTVPALIPPSFQLIIAAHHFARVTERQRF